jgi:hypothetical protein
MLENLDETTLRQRLGLETGDSCKLATGVAAEAARACVRSWRFPARARVTAYLHRQFIAAGFQEEEVRKTVADVIDALIDIGDFTRVLLDGKTCLVLSIPTYVSVGPALYAMLGKTAVSVAGEHNLVYARQLSSVQENITTVPFSDWIGPPGFRTYLARRLSGYPHSSIREFWENLTTTLRDQGSPLDLTKLRAVVGGPDTTDYFGKHNDLTVSGRWATSVPDGIWCGVRPGRSPNEWHPILTRVEGREAQALDLYDWDELAWALLARGIVFRSPERSSWRNGILKFNHPIPAQFVRALRVLGGPEQNTWTWKISEVANHCFDEWRRTLI